MFRTVPNPHDTINTPRCDYVGVLRLISRFVNLARVKYLLLDGEFDCRRITRKSIPSYLPLFIIIIAFVGCFWFWNFDIRNL
jgi:hypothetical protein